MGSQADRYWQLLASINDQPPRQSSVPRFEWLITAMHADAMGMLETKPGHAGMNLMRIRPGLVTPSGLTTDVAI